MKAQLFLKLCIICSAIPTLYMQQCFAIDQQSISLMVNRLIAKNGSQLPLPARQLIVSELVDSVPDAQPLFLYDIINGELGSESRGGDVSSELTSISKKYAKQKDKDAMGYNIVSTAFTGTGLLLNAGAALATGGTSLILLPVINATMNKTMDFALKRMEERNRTAALMLLSKNLAEMDSSTLKDLESYQDSDSKVIRDVAEKYVMANEATFLSNIDLEDRPDAKLAFTSRLTVELAGQIAEESGLRKQAIKYVEQKMELGDEKLQMQINESRSDMIAIASALTEYQKETNNGLMKLSQNQLTLAYNINQNTIQINELTEIAKNTQQSISDLQQDTNFLKNYSYNHMTLEEKISAIAPGGPLAVIFSEEKLMRERIKLDNEKLKQEIIATTANILDGAKVVLNVASRFGLNQKMAAEINSAISYGDKAFTVAKAYMSGNPLAMATAVSNLFSRKGGDIAGARHAQVMKALGQLMLGQQEILENQKKLFDNQNKIFNEIISLRALVNESTNLLLAAIEANREEVLYNRSLITESIVFKEIKQCSDFISDKYIYADDFKYSQKYEAFNNFSGLSEYMNTNSRSFSECSDGLRYALRSIEQIKPQLSMRSYIGADSNYDQTIKYIKYYHRPVSRFLFRNAEKIIVGLPVSSLADNEIYDIFFSLSSPGTNVSEIESKMSQSLGTYSNLQREDFGAQKDYTYDQSIGALKSEVNYFYELLDEPIYYQRLIRYVDMALQVTPYLDIVGVNNQLPQSFESLLDSPAKITSKILLKGALKRINLGIAQQSLLAGDVIIPQMYRYFSAKDKHEFEIDGATDEEKRECSTSDEYYNTICMLSKNYELASNFVKYAIKRDLKSKNGSFSSFKVAQSIPENSEMIMMSLHSKVWQFYWHADRIDAESNHEKLEGLIRPAGWYVLFDSGIEKQYIRLPDALESLQSEMVYRPEMAQLMQEKAYILDALVNYTLPDSLTESEFKTINLSIINSLPIVKNVSKDK